MRIRATLQGLMSAALVFGLAVSGLGCGGEADIQVPDGTWDCTTAWTWDDNGEPTPCSYVQRATCKDTRFTSESVLSLGDAQWSETSEGTCETSGQELVTTRTAVQTTPKNDIARTFEEQRLAPKGMSLAPKLPTIDRSRVVSLDATTLVSVNGEGKTTTCTRL